MDAQVSYAFHSERKLHPEKFKNQLYNQVSNSSYFTQLELDLGTNNLVFLPSGPLSLAVQVIWKL